MTKSKDDARTFSISELAREFDVTTRSIRFYEDQGLLNPTRQGQHRIYSRQDRVRLKLTLRGKRLGFSLAEIRELFDLYDADKSSRSQLQTMLGLVADKRETLQQQLEDIQMVLLELEAAEQRCRQFLRLMAQALPTPAQPHAHGTAKGAPGELPALKEIARLLDLAPETACRALARARKSVAAAGTQPPARPSAWSYFGLPGAAATPAHALAC